MLVQGKLKKHGLLKGEISTVIQDDGVCDLGSVCLQNDKSSFKGEYIHGSFNVTDLVEAQHGECVALHACLYLYCKKAIVQAVLKSNPEVNFDKDVDALRPE